MKKEIFSNCKFIVFIIFLLIFTQSIVEFYNLEFKNELSLILVLVVFFIILLRNKLESNCDKKVKLASFVLAIVYSGIYLVGTYIQKVIYKDFDINSIKIIDLIQYFFAFSFILYYIVQYILIVLKEKEITFVERKKTGLLFIVLIIFLLGAWFPYFKSFAPGLLSNDSISQWGQAVGQTGLSNHHPIIHTGIIKLATLVGGENNNGIVVYSIIQSIIMATIFSYTMVFLYKKGLSSKILILIFAFYAFVPIFGFYSVTMWKDVLFGTFALFFAIQLMKFAENQASIFESKKELILTILSILLFGLFRNNAIFALVLIAAVCVIISKKEIRKKSSILFGGTILILLCVKGPIYKVFDIPNGHFVENLGIPLRQISSVVVNDYNMDSEDYEYMNKLIPIDVLKEVYDPTSVDTIKFNEAFDNEFLENNKGEFFKIWFKYCLKYPKIYVITYLESTFGFWYPDTEGYVVHLWEIDENEFGVENYDFDNLNIVERYTKFYYTPGLRYFVSDAIYFMGIAFVFFVGIFKQKRLQVLPLSIPIILWGTIMIATPVSFQARYVFSNYTIFPLALYILLKIFEKKQIIIEKEKEKEKIMNRKLSIVIPVYNEEKSVIDLIEKVKSVPLGDIEKEIIVVDDCSTDGTRERLEREGKNIIDKLVLHEVNQGKGAALRTGFKEATGGVVIVQDADFEYDPMEYPQIINPIFNGEADVVFGSRFLEGSNFGGYKQNRIANKVLTGLSNFMTGLKVTDMETCYKAFKTELIQSIDIKENRFGFEPEITAKVAKKKAKLIEVPISYYPRTKEEGKKIKAKDGIRALYCIAKYKYQK